MNEFERLLRESEETLLFAFDGLKEAKREEDETPARQACEKEYLALIKAFNALFIKRGKKVEELLQGERGRRFLIHTLAGKELDKFCGAMKSSLHIDGFHEGIIIFNSLEEDLNVREI